MKNRCGECKFIPMAVGLIILMCPAALYHATLIVPHNIFLWGFKGICLKMPFIPILHGN